jgi:hypothetical protein
MPQLPFHLGWFMNFTAGEWDSDFAVGGAPWDGKFYIDMAQALERACFDYIMLEDTVMVSESYGGSTEAALRHALMVPKHDPCPLAAVLGTATKHLGILATMTTLACPPLYAISRPMDARVAVAALKAAIRSRKPGKGCIQYSDRDSQYASETDHGGLPVDPPVPVGTRFTADLEVRADKQLPSTKAARMGGHMGNTGSC